MLTILGLDPGTVNFGWSVVQARRKPDGHLQYRILACGVVPPQHTVRSVVGTTGEEMAVLLRWVRGVVTQYGVDLMIGERFQPRSSILGSNTELIGMVFGALIAENLAGRLPPVERILPATWKNRTRRGAIGDLKFLYRGPKQRRVRYQGSNHELDATCIALYLAYQKLEPENMYHGVDAAGLADRIHRNSTDPATAKRLRLAAGKLSRVPVSKPGAKVLPPRKRRRR